MMKKSVSGGWKAVVLILLFLSELVLCAGILGNIEGVCNFLTAHGLEAVVTFLHRTLFFLIEVGAAVVLIIDTMIAAITKVTRKFPSLMTVLAFIYNDLAAIATVFGIYMFGQPKAWFPYPLAFLIPAITEAPVRTPRREAPKPEKVDAEPAFFVTPAKEDDWAAARPEPEVVPATESVQMPVHAPIDVEPVVTSHISKDNVSADAVAAVDDLFFAFSDSDYVEDE